MLRELVLIAIVMAAGMLTTRLWPSNKGWAVVTCLLTALLVTWLARRWGIDLSGVS